LYVIDSHERDVDNNFHPRQPRHDRQNGIKRSLKNAGENWAEYRAIIPHSQFVALSTPKSAIKVLILELIKRKRSKGSRKKFSEI